MLPTPWTRRHFISLALMTASSSLCALPASAAAPGISTDKIVLGQSVALSGPLGELGREVTTGAQAYFKALNARGGIQGRKVELLVRDDGYDPAKALDINAGWQNQVFAFFSPFGTGPSEAVLQLAQKNRIPVLMPFTGSSTLRQSGNTVTANVRASYEDEARQMVRHMLPLGLTRISVAYQDTSFGKEVLRATTEALAANKLALAGSASIKGDGSNAAQAAATIAAGKPLSVIVGVGGKPAVETIKALQRALPGVHLYTLSVFSNSSNFAALGQDGRGVTVTQVMPFPTAMTLPLTRNFKTDMLAAGFAEKDLSHPALEGYINAAIFAEAMTRAGKDPSRENLLQTLYGMKDVNIGGYRVSFKSNNANSASQAVSLTVINANGALAR